MIRETINITSEWHYKTVAAVLRSRLTDLSWSKIEKFVTGRYVQIDGNLCLDPARRVKEGEGVEILDKPAQRLPDEEQLVLRHVDAHVVVVEKPAGIATNRHPVERDWSVQRKALSPTLDDMVTKKLARRENISPKDLPRVRLVHRLDKQTSGLLVFARTVTAERALGKQFKAHTVHRRYLAIVPGELTARTITSHLVRDRGDGRRGSTNVAGQGKRAVTHIAVEERLPGYTLLSCRLETGRTHQIRIHLAENGHPICSDPVYHRLPSGKILPDASGAPRLALHAVELGFVHPVSEDNMMWTMPLPHDLEQFLERLRDLQNER